jgi:hypothetical protein
VVESSNCVTSDTTFPLLPAMVPLPETKGRPSIDTWIEIQSVGVTVAMTQPGLA